MSIAKRALEALEVKRERQSAAWRKKTKRSHCEVCGSPLDLDNVANFRLEICAYCEDKILANEQGQD